MRRNEWWPAVYPRTGGGTSRFGAPTLYVKGLSRTGGGTRIEVEAAFAGNGSIPAQAGEPERHAPKLADRGSIPAQAGEPRRCRGTGAGVGSIPAQAGEPMMFSPIVMSSWVYPRTGGGTHALSRVLVRTRGLSPHRRGNQKRRQGRRPASGLSPHRRGNRRTSARCSTRTRSIPAQAGEPSCNESSSPSIRVYPRTGGGTSPSPSTGSRGSGLSPHRRGTGPSGLRALDGQGLSPHRRGNRRHRRHDRRVVGSIPAQAGEPFARVAARLPTGVYPRTGGGTIPSDDSNIADGGLSPHRRGNHRQHPRGIEQVGSIPAQAGEPAIEVLPAIHSAVYPRTGGGTGVSCFSFGGRMGLSPHRRGNQQLRMRAGPDERSIPAQAGEPAASASIAVTIWVYPRTGGGTSFMPGRLKPSQGLSPHRRGNRRHRRHDRRVVGSIPAQAGEPRASSRSRPRPWVYPRTGGGTFRAGSSASAYGGLSPHRRGNHRQHPRGIEQVGSIPAQAGEPAAPDARRSRREVYPRTGGEPRSTSRISKASWVYPRTGGGNRRQWHLSELRPGSIPAQAGEPERRRS